MDKTKSLYAIYKYDFHVAAQRLVQAAADGVDGSKYVKIAQNCFASLFDQNTIDNLAKMNKKGEATRLPNDVMAKVGDIFIWRVNNSPVVRQMPVPLDSFLTLSANNSLNLEKLSSSDKSPNKSLPIIAQE